SPPSILSCFNCSKVNGPITKSCSSAPVPSNLINGGFPPVTIGFVSTSQPFTAVIMNKKTAQICTLLCVFAVLIFSLYPIRPNQMPAEHFGCLTIKLCAGLQQAH